MTGSEIQHFNESLDRDFAAHLAWLMRQLNNGLEQVKQLKPYEINKDTSRVARESLYIFLGRIRTQLANSMPEMSPQTTNVSSRLQLAVRLNEFSAAIPAVDEKS